MNKYILIAILVISNLITAKIYHKVYVDEVAKLTSTYPGELTAIDLLRLCHERSVIQSKP